MVALRRRRHLLEIGGLPTSTPEALPFCAGLLGGLTQEHVGPCIQGRGEWAELPGGGDPRGTSLRATHASQPVPRYCEKIHGEGTSSSISGRPGDGGEANSLISFPD